MRFWNFTLRVTRKLSNSKMHFKSSIMLSNYHFLLNIRRRLTLYKEMKICQSQTVYLQSKMSFLIFVMSCYFSVVFSRTTSKDNNICEVKLYSEANFRGNNIGISEAAFGQ